MGIGRDAVSVRHTTGRSHNLFIGRKWGSKVGLKLVTLSIGECNTSAEGQIIDTSRTVGILSLDEFRQPGKTSEDFGIDSSYDVLRKGALSKYQVGKVEDKRITESVSRKGIPDFSDEVQTGSEERGF